MIPIPKYCIVLITAIIISLVIVIYFSRKQIKEMKIELTLTKVALAICQLKEKSPMEAIDEIEDVIKVKGD